MTPEQFAVELEKMLPTSTANMSLEESRRWVIIAETLSDEKLATLIRVVEALGSPMSLLLRGMLLAKRVRQ